MVWIDRVIQKVVYSRLSREGQKTIHNLLQQSGPLSHNPYSRARAMRAFRAAVEVMKGHRRSAGSRELFEKQSNCTAAISSSSGPGSMALIEDSSVTNSVCCCEPPPSPASVSSTLRSRSPAPRFPALSSSVLSSILL